MNLLLLLSALLSALTGVVPGARGQAATQAVACSAVASEAARAVDPGRAMRPTQPLATLVAVAFAAPLHVVQAVAAPLWASRRRE